MKIIMVVGCQRSGTTLTGQILGAHSQSFLIDETDGLYPWFDAWVSRAPDFEELSRSVIGKAAKKYCDGRAKISSFADVSSMNLILKAPNLTYRFEEISKLGEPPFIVYPVRDVRSVVASMQKLSNIPMIENQINFLQSIPKLALELSTDLTVMRDKSVPTHIKHATIWTIKTGLFSQFFTSALNPCVFKYEDLVEDSELQVRRLTEHCNVEFQPEQLQYHRVMTGIGPGNTSRNREIDHGSLNKWSKELSYEQIKDVLEVGKNVMKELRYENHVN